MKQYLTLIIIFLSLCLDAQQSVPYGLRNTSPLTTKDAVLFNNVEEVILPDEYRYRSLPDSLDNSKYEWFRPIFSQTTYPNCMQSTSIAYNFTYEMCRLRNLPADNPDNQFGTHFAWNFFNGGNGWYGVNYLFTMDVLKHHGTPSVTDYGGLYAGGGQRWMSGYDEWYNAMNNRISGIRKIYVGNEEGLLTLKHWLNDHLDGSETGGVASFIACSPWNYVNIDPGLPHAGEKVIPAWCPEALHGMTIVGYNDFISFDYNEDGQYTNDIDLNGDGILDMRDWEVGALKFANSYGEDWADSGFCFMMYKTLADDSGEGGIWLNTVHIVDAKEQHDTRMTYKISLEHDFRKLIRVQTGISSDLESNIPEHIHDYTIFNYQGDKHYMQGIDSLPEYKTIEFGLDVTSLLSYVTPGEEYKFFLIIDENDPQNLANGQVKRFSLMDYNDGVTEIPCDQQNVSLLENGRTLLSINYSPDFDPLLVKTQSLPLYTPGQANVVQLEAEGGQEPYSWKLDRNYLMSENAAEFPSFNEELIIENSFEDSLAVQQLDFSFPFYGNSFDSVIVSSSGYLYFDENMYFWSYINDLAYYLKNVRIVAPFLCDEMIVNNYYDQGVWYEGDENKASFRWKTTFPELSELSSCNFAVTLYPNGNIDIYYGEVEAYQELRWVAGISDGDQCNYNLLNLPKPSLIIPGTKYELIAGESPSSVTLSKEGNLSFMESNEASNTDVKVIVTDNTLLKASKTFQLTDGLELHLSLSGSEDNTISNGQLAGMDLILHNRGSVGLNNLVFDLSCEHPLIKILDGQHNIESIAAGESIELSDVFSLNCDQSMGDKQHIALHLDVQTSDRDYQRDFYLKSKAPSVKMIEYQLLSELGILEPGETTELKLRILNEGSREAGKVLAILRAEVPGIIVNTSQPLNFGAVSPGNYATASFSITPDYSIQYGTKVYFNLKLICEGGRRVNQGLLCRMEKRLYVLSTWILIPLQARRL